jgi:hypothetical protein
MSGRRACKRVKHFGLDLTVPGVLSLAGSKRDSTD